MAILTDLPNELLLTVIADVSPLYIDSFALTCKRIHSLSVDTIREHKVMGRNLVDLPEADALRTMISNPPLALILRSIKLPYFNVPGDVNGDLVAEIRSQALQDPLMPPLRADAGFYSLVVLLLLSRLLNLREIDITLPSPGCLEFVHNVVEASYCPIPAPREPLALGMLTQAQVSACFRCEMELAILLAMLPSLRKLRVLLWFSSIPDLEPFVFTHQHRSAGVTDIYLRDGSDVTFTAELISRTNILQRFTYQNNIWGSGSPGPSYFQPRKVVKLLIQYAKHSLNYLNLSWLPRDPEYEGSNCAIYAYNIDLSGGSLRGFSVLKTLVMCVDMFIKRGDRSEYGSGVYRMGAGTVQRLVSWLPASLETMVLQRGLEIWHADVLRMLFRGFRNNKPARIPKLRLINFLEGRDVEGLLSGDLKAAFQETGVKLVYTIPDCGTQDHDPMRKRTFA